MGFICIVLILNTLYNKTIIELIRFSHDIENYQGLGLCYPPQPSAQVHNANVVLDNSRYHAEPHSIIVYYIIVYVLN